MNVVYFALVTICVAQAPCNDAIFLQPSVSYARCIEMLKNVNDDTEHRSFCVPLKFPLGENYYAE